VTAGQAQAAPATQNCRDAVRAGRG
jgi:hypothetical protein